MGVILAVAFLVPNKILAGITIKPFMREGAQLLLVVIAWFTTSTQLRRDNDCDPVSCLRGYAKEGTSEYGYTCEPYTWVAAETSPGRLTSAPPPGESDS